MKYFGCAGSCVCCSYRIGLYSAIKDSQPVGANWTPPKGRASRAHCAGLLNSSTLNPSSCGGRGCLPRRPLPKPNEKSKGKSCLLATIDWEA